MYLNILILGSMISDLPAEPAGFTDKIQLRYFCNLNKNELIRSEG